MHPLTFTVSNYKADIEWLSAYAKPMYFPSVFRELVLLSRNSHNRIDDDVSRSVLSRRLNSLIKGERAKINNRDRVEPRNAQNNHTNIPSMKYSLDLFVVLNGTGKK